MECIYEREECVYSYDENLRDFKESIYSCKIYRVGAVYFAVISEDEQKMMAFISEEDIPLLTQWVNKYIGEDRDEIRRFHIRRARELGEKEYYEKHRIQMMALCMPFSSIQSEEKLVS